jgi:hypothetical protein
MESLKCCGVFITYQIMLYIPNFPVEILLNLTYDLAINDASFHVVGMVRYEMSCKGMFPEHKLC